MLPLVLLLSSALPDASDQIDPLSAFSAIRRNLLLGSLERNRTAHFLTIMNELSPQDPRYLRAVELLVRQNLHVTEQCAPSVSPALAIAQGSRGAVLDFLEEERGHDLLLARARVHA